MTTYIAGVEVKNGWWGRERLINNSVHSTSVSFDYSSRLLVMPTYHAMNQELSMSVKGRQSPSSSLGKFQQPILDALLWLNIYIIIAHCTLDVHMYNILLCLMYLFLCITIMTSCFCRRRSPLRQYLYQRSLECQSAVAAKSKYNHTLCTVQ